MPRSKDYVLTDQTTEQTIQKIHIGNLAPASTEAGVRALFAVHGEVSSYERPLDKDSKVAGAFAYVEMKPAEAEKAIAAVNGKELDGQALRVSQARPPRA